MTYAHLSRMQRFVEVWPTFERTTADDVRAEWLRTVGGFEPWDEVFLLDPVNAAVLNLLWAAAFLHCYGTSADNAWRQIEPTRPGAASQAALTLFQAREFNHLRARRAEKRLAAEGWRFNPEKRWVEAAPDAPAHDGRRTKGNRRKELVTKMVEVVYRETEKYEHDLQPEEVRKEIAHCLEMFFPRELLTDEKIRNAIDNYRRHRRA